MSEIQSVRQVLRSAKKDFRRRLYEKGMFDRGEMKELARTLAREYMSAVSDEDLLRLSRHDNWLKKGKFAGPHNGQQDWPGDSIVNIAEQLYHYLSYELRHMVDQFWQRDTKVVFEVTRNEVELVGFFNEEHPPEAHGVNDPFEEMLDTQDAPYA